MIIIGDPDIEQDLSEKDLFIDIKSLVYTDFRLLLDNIHSYFKGGHVEIVNFGSLNIDQIEWDEKFAIEVNIKFPYRLAEVCRILRGYNPGLAHISTNYVFSGTPMRFDNSEPKRFSEFDEPSPVNRFGKTKLMGEKLVSEAYPNAAIIRTGFLYGEHFGILKKMIEHLSVGVIDQYISPTPIKHLLCQIKRIFEANLRGTIHITSRGYQNAFEVLTAIRKNLGVEGSVRPVSLFEFSLNGNTNGMVRPASCLLRNFRMSALGMNEMPNWDCAHFFDVATKIYERRNHGRLSKTESE